MKPRVIGVLIAALIGGAGYGFYWHYVAGRLEAGINDWAAQQRAMGHEIAFESDPINGFPFVFRTAFRHIGISWALPDARLSLKANKIGAEMQPWNLGWISTSIESDASLQWQPATGPAGAGALSFKSGTAIVELHPDGQLRSVSLYARKARIALSAGVYLAQDFDLAVNLPADPPLDYRQPLLGFKLAAYQLTLPAGQRAVTTGPVEAARISATVLGPVPMAANIPQALSLWSTGGGTVEIADFAFTQAPLKATGAGTMTLDKNLQPLGALTVHAEGLPETIILLEQAGLIDARAAKTGGMMAKGLAKPDAAGHQTVSVSLSLQDGFLWLGPVKLAPLPSLGW